MKKILDALEALCRACPDVSGIGVDILPHGPNFTINCSTDELVHALAEAFGNVVKTHCVDGSRWLAAYGDVTIYGPHRPVVAVDPVDESKVAAALAQADEAVRP